MSNSRVELRGEGPDELRRAQQEAAKNGSRSINGEAIQVEDRPALASLSGRQEWQLACRVASSKGICKSDLLPKFLLYVCEQQLIGNSHEITEQRIGTKIFNRPKDYNPGEDNIVRSYARMLRKRLDEYFEGQGSNEPLRIVIPRGGYVPVFQPASDARPIPPAIDVPEESVAEEAVDSAPVPVAAPLSPHPSQHASPPDSIKHSQSPAWLLISICLLCGALLATAWRMVFPTTWPGKEQSAAHLVWLQFFQQNRNTLIVPSDSSLGILQNLTGHLVSVEEYANKSYLSELKPPLGISAENFNDLLRQRYTSVVDLNVTTMLTHLPEFIPNRSEVRYARSITAEDIKDKNIILVGSSHTNPWVSLFENRMNFRLQYTPAVDESFVLNEQPKDAEQKLYRNGTDATANRTYGVIDYIPGLDGAGHVLIIQGLNMAATQAAADILFDAQAMKPVLRQASLGNGTLKSFELLVETSSIGATAPSAQIIASRFYP